VRYLHSDVVCDGLSFGVLVLRISPVVILFMGWNVRLRRVALCLWFWGGGGSRPSACAIISNQLGVLPYAIPMGWAAVSD
jgi:hypothetical protein